MSMAYVEVQRFEMWGKVKIEKLQNEYKWPKFGKPLNFSRVDEWVSQYLLFGCHAFQHKH